MRVFKALSLTFLALLAIFGWMYLSIEVDWRWVFGAVVLFPMAVAWGWILEVLCD